MDTLWDRDNFERSITRTCFSSTPYDAGWDGAEQWDINGTVLQHDDEMRRLLELEWEIRPVPVWGQKIARQIEEMPPCGWSFPQHVEAVCTNIGSGDAAAAFPSRCYVVGPDRLQLMADYAVCVDGWIKNISSLQVGASLQQNAFDSRDWVGIAAAVWEVLGEPSPPRVLLARRLLQRLRFWLRAPYAPLKADDNWRLGYFYDHGMGRSGGWDYFSFEEHEPDANELKSQIKAQIPDAERWLELIDYTWPCAPKVFRFVERIVIAIGQIEEHSDVGPDELGSRRAAERILRVEGTYLDSETSRGLYNAAVSGLAGFLGCSFPGPGMADARRDTGFASRLQRVLGEPSPEKLWLAALLQKRITLFQHSFKSFHFTRNAHQIA